MKKLLAIIVAAVLIGGLAYVASSATTEKDYAGTYTGFAWKDEAKGVTLEEAKEKLETILTLGSDGTILDAQMNFLVKKEDQWIKRNDPSADVSIDYSIDPVAATPGVDNYKAGTSMFTIKTADFMSFYAVGVNDDGTVAFIFADPMHRYLMEGKFRPGFDFNKFIGEMKVMEDFIPTFKTSNSGFLKPESFDEIKEKSILHSHAFSHVIYDLEMAGVTFDDNKPVPMAPKHGFHSLGGWVGNYEAIRNYLIGKNATEVRALADFSPERYAMSINEENFFGIDVPSGATKTIQNSFDTFSGATVRISRENNSYQRALVEAGILEEKDVIKGRF